MDAQSQTSTRPIGLAVVTILNLAEFLFGTLLTIAIAGSAIDCLIRDYWSFQEFA
jgi:hypothetical protein